MPRPHRPHPMLKVEATGLAQAAELIRNAKRPIILAGHGISESSAMEQVQPAPQTVLRVGFMSPPPIYVYMLASVLHMHFMVGGFGGA